MTDFLVLLILFSCMAIYFLGAATMVPRTRRMRTDREDMLHNQIQQAMNWQPGFPPDNAAWDENNEWTDPRTGEVWKRMTLAEALGKELE